MPTAQSKSLDRGSCIQSAGDSFVSWRNCYIGGAIMRRFVCYIVERHVLERIRCLRYDISCFAVLSPAGSIDDGCWRLVLDRGAASSYGIRSEFCLAGHSRLAAAEIRCSALLRVSLGCLQLVERNGYVFASRLTAGTLQASPSTE